MPEEERIEALKAEGETRLAKKSIIQKAYDDAAAKISPPVDNSDGRGALRSMLLKSTYTPRG